MSIVVDLFDFCFAENGLTAIRLGEQLPSNCFIKWLGEEKYKKLVKFVLHYIADLDIPVKRYANFTLLYVFVVLRWLGQLRRGLCLRANGTHAVYLGVHLSNSETA